MGFSYHECMTIPIWKRRWFIQRLNSEIKKSNGASRGAAQNEPNTRAMQGRGRAQVPAKLRRFT